jgi:hypothetical protein
MAVSSLPGTVLAASEVDILLEKLVEKNILTNVEAGLIRREISETKETRNKELAKEIVPDSARNWKWKGDLRLRNEYRNQEGTGTARNRQRIRFRYGFEGKVSDQLKVNARIATGSSTTSAIANGATSPDPVSTNQSFDTNFGKVGINLDLANLEYTPAVPVVSQVKLIGGIMESPFWSVGPLVFDGDLSYSGAAAKISQEMGPATLFANNGVFSLDTDETEPAVLWVTQGGVAYMPWKDTAEEFLKNLKLTTAIAYQDYMNVTTATKSGTDILAREAQNSSRATDFNQINPTIELASQWAGVPMSVYGDWVHNTSAPSENNDGFQLGLKVGKAKTPLDLKTGWEGGYYFQQLQRDATFDEFADSDFLDGGTNNHGHVFFVTLAALKHSTVGMKYFVTQQIERVVSPGKDHEDRVQLDWVTKF